MGGKRNIQRYKNIFCIAGCLILTLTLAGCNYNYYPKLSLETTQAQEGRECLQKAREYAVKGDFKAAWAENKKAYDSFPPDLKQEAIFQKAFIYAHPDNPDKNYEKAMACLELIDKNTKNIVLASNAALILPILKENSSLEKKAYSNNMDIQDKTKKMEESRDKIDALLKEQRNLINYIAKLKEQIIKLKEVDLNSNKNSGNFK